MVLTSHVLHVVELVVFVRHYTERLALDFVAFGRHELLGLRNLLLTAVIIVLFWLPCGIQKVDYGFISIWCMAKMALVTHL